MMFHEYAIPKDSVHAQVRHHQWACDSDLTTTPKIVKDLQTNCTYLFGWMTDGGQAALLLVLLRALTPQANLYPRAMTCSNEVRAAK